MKALALNAFSPEDSRFTDLPEVLTTIEAARLLRCSKAHFCNLLNGRVAECRGSPISGLADACWFVRNRWPSGSNRWKAGRRWGWYPHDQPRSNAADA